MPNSVRPDSETREAILRTAGSLFLERGYAKSKVVDIARAAGITPATMYWHFESKGDLLFEYLKVSIAEFNTLMAEAIAGVEGPVALLRTLTEAHTGAQLRFRERAQVVLSMTRASADLITALPPAHAAEIDSLVRVHVDLVKGIVGEGVASGHFQTPDITALTFAVLNISENAALWFRPDGPLSVDAVAAANGEFAVRMATAPPPSTQ